MSIPVITDHFHAQWIWRGISGLPTDVFVNNFYFRNDDPISQTYGDVQANISNSLQDFFTDVQASGFALQTFMSQDIVSASLKVYDLGVSPPRYPIVPEENIAIAGNSSGDDLPHEVACVLSYYGGQGPRRRGRVYLGPLKSSVVTSGPSGRAVDEDFRLTATQAAEGMRNGLTQLTWVQVSPTDGVASVVQGGWCDDAFDTQRSRGGVPTTRTTFGNPPS